MESMPLVDRIALGFQQWVGWGWAAAGVIWIGGTVLILRELGRRLPSRIFTAAAVVAWTVIVLAVASRLFGFRPPLAM